jgi:hypothetical protein
MDQGDRLEWLKAKVPKRSWSTWRENTNTPRRTDENYRRLAAHRDLIGQALADGKIKSINDALKVLRNPRATPPTPPRSELSKMFWGVTDDERRALLAERTVDDFMSFLPTGWEDPLAQRITKMQRTRNAAKQRRIEASRPVVPLIGPNNRSASIH